MRLVKAEFGGFGRLADDRVSDTKFMGIGSESVYYSVGVPGNWSL
jgi:hypothetical protein